MKIIIKLSPRSLFLKFQLASNYFQLPSGTGKVVNLVHLDEKWFNNIVVNKLKIFMSDPMLNISSPSSEKVIDHNYLIFI